MVFRSGCFDLATFSSFFFPWFLSFSINQNSMWCPNWAIWRIKLKLKDSVELPIGSRAERQEGKSRRCGLEGERDLGVETEQSENTKIDANWEIEEAGREAGLQFGEQNSSTLIRDKQIQTQYAKISKLFSWHGKKSANYYKMLAKLGEFMAEILMKSDMWFQLVITCLWIF